MNNFLSVIRWHAVLYLFLIMASCRTEPGFRELPEGAILFVPSAPTVKADSARVENLPANFFGSITSSGSDSVMRYGFCFSAIKAQPTLSDSIVETSTKIDDFPFSYSLTSSKLKRGTQYYLRAFSENKQGVAYSETVISFVVPDNSTIPNVITDGVENVTGTSANIKGVVNADGDSPITAYGICYSSTNENPDINDLVAITGTSAPLELPYAFGQSLETLTDNTTYYVRAFASNAIGTAYGNKTSFKTATASTVSPTVQTFNVININASSANIDGAIVAKGTADITQYGFCYSTTNKNPTTADLLVESGSTSTENFPFTFTGALNNLTESTAYYVRAFATSSAGTSYGVTRTFRTISKVTSPPTVKTIEVPSTSITTTAAVARGSIDASGTSPITKYGFCYSTTNANPSIADQTLISGTTSPASFPLAFSGNLINLLAGTQYYMRAFAVNGVGTSYGTALSFRTVPLATTPPAVQTVNVSGVSFFSANVLGNITSAGTASITAYGVVYSATNGNPTITDSKVVVGSSSPGTLPFGFTAALNGLSANTTYSAKTYATSSAGTSYGEVKRFVTRIATPVITTDQVVFNQPINSIAAKGTIQSSGATPITRYGFCYSSTKSTPDNTDNATDAGSIVTGSFPFSFTQNITRLPAGNYFFRAYAFNADGVAYGGVNSITVFNPPAVSTESATEKDAAAGIETLFGSITSGGSSPIQEYGFCYIPTASIGRSGFKVGDANVAIIRKSTPVPTSFPFGYLLDVTVSYNVDYSYKAYVKTVNGYWYGSVKTFYISYKP
jgi:hypothetical protein